MSLPPIMTPATGERVQRFVGDSIRFSLQIPGGTPVGGWSARLRTNLGRAEVLRREIIQAHTRGLPVAGASWRDLPMEPTPSGWALELPLAEVGYFKAKAFLLDPEGWQHWPEGADLGISVHPNAYRSANTVYCAFPRLLGQDPRRVGPGPGTLESPIQRLEALGHSVLPPSGKIRDLIRCLPHILDTLGCRILHLLPVHPTPTTYARFGRFGSPYAALDLTAVDPALVVFDKHSTGIEQFCELTSAVHRRGARVLLDIVINHTGWSSALQEKHPEWFLRNEDGSFASPGAWGTTWEDLVELKHDNVALWDELSEMFLTWSRLGVDGFRCDAGYKVPEHAWQYITARVRQEFPDALFLLEGLGGAWELTESLLTEGGMQWAYSELFQNEPGPQIADYLDHSLRQSRRVGLLTHYSETHDNNRLAKRGRSWSLLRNRLCALTSVSGGFGFTSGVEWLAEEKIDVHQTTGLAWENPDNLVPELAALNRLLSEHPCFFDGAQLTRLSPSHSPIYALYRCSEEGKDAALVLVNNDIEQARELTLSDPLIANLKSLSWDLLGQSLPTMTRPDARSLTVRLEPGAAFCLAENPRPEGLSGDAYRRARARSAWAMQRLNEQLRFREIGRYDWRTIAEWVDASPARFLSALTRLRPESTRPDLQAALAVALDQETYPKWVRWNLADRRRVVPIPPGHWLLLEDSVPFRATLERTPADAREDHRFPRVHVESIAAGGAQIACFAPSDVPAEARLHLERFCEENERVEASVRFLDAVPGVSRNAVGSPGEQALVLLTNGLGGMARLPVDLGRVQSKYDCVLGANLHPSLPVDRHVFAKRIRLWANADGFISPLDSKCLAAFHPGPPASWQFVANAGDGRSVSIRVDAWMVQGRNTTLFRFQRPVPPAAPRGTGPPGFDVRLTARVDIEDRNFHWETKRNGGADYHFSTHTRTLEPLPRPDGSSQPASEQRVGFSFDPAPDRQLRVVANAGQYHPQPEWSENIGHPIEQSRGLTGSGDAYSPGWFDLPLAPGGEVWLAVTAEATDPLASAFILAPEAEPDAETLEERLRQAAPAYVVRRGSGKTVIAGYPWFLDWGRDTLICSRGLLTAGLVDDVRQILFTFAGLERNGTLPNSLNGDDASNRDTSDAPLWFGVACEELGISLSGGRQASDGGSFRSFYASPVEASGRTLADILCSIARSYVQGTANGIRMDQASALIWSPSHFTWMDTNHPAGTPREGYPVEIQALWIRLLRHAAAVSGAADKARWTGLADRALASFEQLFWMEPLGWYADVLLARPGATAAQAVASDALRPNCLLPISLGLVQGNRGRRCVEAARRHLVVPGALRSLAPLPVAVPLPVPGHDGRLLNNPVEPYWGRYEGDEDTRRKPAYHNGTAWTWMLPVFCEALARAWDFSPEAVEAACAYLGSVQGLLDEGCLGQIPEILDGDAPHTPRGCDAQAWGVTEALRVWKLLNDRLARQEEGK